MPDLVLLDDQSVSGAIQLRDAAGNVVQGTLLDPGSVTATAADPDVLAASVSTDGGTLTVAALGPEATGVEVTVEGTVAGVPLEASVSTFDVSASPPLSIVVVFGAPTTNPPSGGTATGPVAS